ARPRIVRRVVLPGSRLWAILPSAITSGGAYATDRACGRYSCQPVSCAVRGASAAAFGDARARSSPQYVTLAPRLYIPAGAARGGLRRRSKHPDRISFARGGLRAFARVG